MTSVVTVASFAVAVCACGHTVKEHAPMAKVRVTARPCLVAGCECAHFHQARPEGEAPDAA